MTVYVVHPVRDNIAPALRFGDFKFITGGYVYGDLLEPHGQNDWVLPSTFQGSFEYVAHQFQPDADYLLVVGDHLQLLAFTMMLGQLHSSFMVLRYDRKLDDYIPVRLHSHLSRHSEAKADLVRHPAPVLQRTDIGETNNGQDGSKIERLNREAGEPRSSEWVTQQYKRNPPGS